MVQNHPLWFHALLTVLTINNAVSVFLHIQPRVLNLILLNNIYIYIIYIYYKIIHNVQTRNAKTWLFYTILLYYIEGGPENGKGTVC